MHAILPPLGQSEMQFSEKTLFWSCSTTIWHVTHSSYTISRSVLRSRRRITMNVMVAVQTIKHSVLCYTRRSRGSIRGRRICDNSGSRSICSCLIRSGRGVRLRKLQLREDWHITFRDLGAYFLAECCEEGQKF